MTTEATTTAKPPAKRTTTPPTLTKEQRDRGRENRWAEHRRKRAEAEKALEGYLDQAIRTLASALLDADALKAGAKADAHALRAAENIVDRVLGKAVQRTELTGADSGPVVVTDDVTAAQAQAVLSGLAEVGLLPRADTAAHPDVDA